MVDREIVEIGRWLTLKKHGSASERNEGVRDYSGTERREDDCPSDRQRPCARPTTGGTEIVVANDGSTDCTAEILLGYGDRITLVTLEPSGVSAARNAAVNVARGKYIAFLDADDEWLPYKLARTVPVLDQHPECVLVYHDALGVDVTGTSLQQVVRRSAESLWPSLEQLLREDFCTLPSCTVMRREVYQRCGGCREELERNQDSFLFLWPANRDRSAAFPRD